MSHSLVDKHNTEEQADLLLYSLSQEEQAFVLALMEGRSQVEAYLVGHPDCTRDAAMVGGSRWIRRDKIAAAREELLDLQASEALRVLRSAAGEAARKLVLSMREPGPDGDRAAKDILDRVGVMGGARLEITQGRQQDLRGFIEADDASE